ncbi:MAG: transcriptional regulator, TetR family [Eubacterium sp.]|jgi:AcrR family transcriptional regulator|nr:transcriptional regulator, TetR family [Eubacterium sp.]
MNISDIREPKQQRSIEKKKKIVEAGFKLFSEKGYHNTNTAEIAKEAGVSTGIVYNYFKDKKGIFLMAVQAYAERIIQPVFKSISELRSPFDLTELLEKFIEALIESHDLSRTAHEEMLAMSHTDEDVRNYFCYFEETTTNTIVKLMEQHGIKPANAYEKVHIAMGMIENLCHEIVYHKHEYMNYEVMKKEVVSAVVKMVSDQH